MTYGKRTAAFLAVLAGLTWASAQSAPHDPGPRPGQPGAGGPFPTLNATEQAAFAAGLARFIEVNDQVPRGNGSGGLGPGFNSNSCVSCHSQPATLGTSPSPTSPQAPQPNPEIAAGLSTGAANVIPSFVTPNGPAREARFIRRSDGTPDGGVHDLFSIAGRTDAGSCTLPQPNFAAQLAANNVSFRIPTPVFGLGLIENTSDWVLQANLAATARQRAVLGIGGRFNLSSNDGTINKFGWKAQNKSLMMFAGEAYNVELGVSNEVMSNERNIVQGCVFNATPEDSRPNSDIEAFVDVMRLAAPPTPAPTTRDTASGADTFAKIGCALCHSQTLTTAQAPFTGMSYVKYHPFSDFAIHHMGTNLADRISQGLAGSDEFRTAPLWGVGQRLFFLHDGRSTDLLNAIQQHRSQGSEANAVIQRFNNLPPQQRQQLLVFLRSL